MKQQIDSIDDILYKDEFGIFKILFKYLYF